MQYYQQCEMHLVNFLILLIVSLETFLLIEVSFSNLLTAVIAKWYKSSSLVLHHDDEHIHK